MGVDEGTVETEASGGLESIQEFFCAAPVSFCFWAVFLLELS